MSIDTQNELQKIKRSKNAIWFDEDLSADFISSFKEEKEIIVIIMGRVFLTLPISFNPISTFFTFVMRMYFCVWHRLSAKTQHIFKQKTNKTNPAVPTE